MVRASEWRLEGGSEEIIVTLDSGTGRDPRVARVRVTDAGLVLPRQRLSAKERTAVLAEARRFYRLAKQDIEAAVQAFRSLSASPPDHSGLLTRMGEKDGESSGSSSRTAS